MKSPRCILYDESRILRYALREMVAPLGFQCVEAANEGEAIQLAREPSYLLLFPWSEASPQFLSRLREQMCGNPRLIACSPRSDMETMHAAVSAGADEFLIKPFDASILHSKLALLGLLSKARSRR